MAFSSADKNTGVIGFLSNFGFRYYVEFIFKYFLVIIDPIGPIIRLL